MVDRLGTAEPSNPTLGGGNSAKTIETLQEPAPQSLARGA
jgi:hypothetical protein